MTYESKNIFNCTFLLQIKTIDLCGNNNNIYFMQKERQQAQPQPETFFNQLADGPERTSFSFYFPPSGIEDKTFGSRKQLCAYLKRLGNKMGMKSFLSQGIRLNGVKQCIRLYCGQCEAKAKWNYEDNVFKLTDMFNFHTHSRRSATLLRSRVTQRFIKTRTCKTSQQIESYLLKKQAYIYEQQQNKEIEPKQFAKFTEEIQRLGYTIKLNQTNPTKFPQIFLAVSETMKESFQTCGDVVWFITLFGNKMQNKEGCGKLGLFVGVDGYVTQHTFGVSIISNFTQDSYYNLFKKFIEVHGTSFKIFVTPPIDNIKLGVQKLKNSDQFKGRHIFNIFETLEMIENLVKQQDALDNYKSLLAARNKAEYYTFLKQIQAIEKSETILQNITKNVDYYCYSFFPAELIGPPNLNLKFKKYKEYISSKFPDHYDPMCTFFGFHKIQNKKNFLQRSILRPLKAYSSIFDDEGLFQLGMTVSKEVFQQFFQGYIRAAKLSVKPVKSSQRQIKFLICSTHQEHTVWKVKKNWKCECDFTEKSGVPCEHIIKLLIFQGDENYVAYFDEKWILPQLIHGVNCSKPGRPRKSRRRNIKF